jgi:hypothetical protein
LEDFTMSHTHEHRLDEARAEARHDLEEIADELREIRERADHALRTIGGVTERRARSYWFAQLTMLISADHDYMGGAGHTLEDTIGELEGGEEE